MNHGRNVVSNFFDRVVLWCNLKKQLHYQIAKVRYRVVACFWPLFSWVWPPCIKVGYCQKAELGSRMFCLVPYSAYQARKHSQVMPSAWDRWPEAIDSTVLTNSFMVVFFSSHWPFWFKKHCVKQKLPLSIVPLDSEFYTFFEEFFYCLRSGHIDVWKAVGWYCFLPTGHKFWLSTLPRQWCVLHMSFLEMTSSEMH